MVLFYQYIRQFGLPTWEATVKGPYLTEPRSRIIGLMSGTSVDSIDAALCDLWEEDNGRIQASLLGFHEHPMPATLRERIFQLFEDGNGSLSLACSLNFEIGEAFADAALALIAQAGVPKDSVTAIASHGQTAYHIPPHMAGVVNGTWKTASTLQIGEATVIAQRTGLPVVADFRVADMAAGGNGAPLVPFADFHLFSRVGESIVVQNIGGIANCTLVPDTGVSGDVVAFDTGPGNMIIDGLTHHFYPTEKYDRDGHHARNGKPLESLLHDWMAMEYIQSPPPKTTGRELFGLPFVRQIVEDNPREAPDDLIATATWFTAASIAFNLCEFILRVRRFTELICAGGGAENGFLVEAIGIEMQRRIGGQPVRIVKSDEIGMPSKPRECVAFTVLGHARLRGIPANVPSATGAREPVLLGKITEP